MKSLATLAYRKRRFVVLGWIALLVGLTLLSSAVKGEFHTEFELAGSESQEALDLLTARGLNERTGIGGQIVFRADQGVNNPGVRRAMEDYFAGIQSGIKDVQVVSPYSPTNAYQISKDGKVAYAEINFSLRDQEQYIKDAEVVKELRRRFGVSGLQV